MKNPNYTISPIEQAEAKEFKQEPDVPIIDVMRHGETRGKQGAPDKERPLNTNAPGFKLDSQYLDLTEEGISNIRAQAEDLAKRINKKREMVLIVSSPAWRTNSSALVVEEVLRENGVNILNPEAEIRLFGSIDQMQAHEQKIIERDYADEDEDKIGKHFQEIMNKAYDLGTENFQKFLRHMNNIYDWLKPETLLKLKGKKLRIIVLAHSETTADFIGETFQGSAAHQSKGQVLEITPRAKLHTGQETQTKLVMYPASRGSEAKTEVVRGFAPETEKEAKPEFALNKWGYNETDVRQLIDKVSKNDAALKTELEQALKEGGGKAFGLKICELIAKNFGAIPYRLNVPKWEIVKNAYQVDERAHQRSILRTSDPKEDWLDPRSGVGRSFNFDNYFDYSSFPHVKKQRGLAKKTPYVLQDAEEGWGLVVDIGHSTLANKVVVKIASGNTRRAAETGGHGRGSFTSATEDAEASVGVWEADTGHPTLPTANFGHTSLYPNNLEFLNTLVKPLYESVKRTGIDFGVQLELIVYPDNPLDIYLVQTRPTPKKVYNNITNEPGEVKKEARNLIAKSAVVNGAFDVTGEVVFFDRKGIGANLSLGSEADRGLVPDISQREQGGKVGIYLNTAGDLTGDELSYAKASSTYLGGYLRGSDVQITPRAIRPNTHHGSMDYGHLSEQVYNVLDQNCGMVSLDMKQIKKMAEKNRPLKLRITSDGLIAEVYSVE